MSLFCFGLSHQTAAVDVRERFAIPESALPEALARLKTMPGLTEGLIVSTCNRTEFYVTGEFRDSSAPAFFESCHPTGMQNGFLNAEWKRVCGRLSLKWV